MAQRSRSRIVSVAVIILIVVVAGVMYLAFGNQGGFTGVPRLLPGDFASGTTGSIVNTIVYALLMAGLFVLLGVIVYSARRLRD